MERVPRLAELRRRVQHAVHLRRIDRVRRRVELPPGAAVTRAPEGVGVADAGLSAARKGTYGAVIEEDFTLNLPTGTVSAEAYQGFVALVRAIDDSFMAGTRVREKP